MHVDDDRQAPKPACLGCVLEARERVPAGLTMLEAGNHLYQRLQTCRGAASRYRRFRTGSVATTT
jgi:hypothetical protein